MERTLSKKIQPLAAQLTSVQSKADRTWKLTFNTQELGEDAAKLTAMLMDMGWLVFSPNDDIVPTDIPEIHADVSLDEKSPSQRLRNVLYVYYKQTRPKSTWEVFYTTQMNRMVDIIKDKLEPEG